MGHSHSHNSDSSPENVPDIAVRRKSSIKAQISAYVPALEKLFQVKVYQSSDMSFFYLTLC